MKGWKMNKKILVFLLMGMFLLNTVLAVDYKSHKQNTDFTLAITSNNATQCNLTSIEYPQGTLANTNIELTQDGTTFYTSIDGGNYSELGVTCHNILCTDGSTKITGDICIDTTPSGFSDTLGFYFILIVVAGAFVFLGFKISDPWFVVAGGMGFALIGLYSINYGIAGQRDMFITWGIGLFEIFMGAYLAIRAGLETMD